MSYLRRFVIPVFWLFIKPPHQVKVSIWQSVRQSSPNARYNRFGLNQKCLACKHANRMYLHFSIIEFEDGTLDAPTKHCLRCHTFPVPFSLTHIHNSTIFDATWIRKPKHTLAIWFILNYPIYSKKLIRLNNEQHHCRKVKDVGVRKAEKSSNSHIKQVLVVLFLNISHWILIALNPNWHRPLCI